MEGPVGADMYATLPLIYIAPNKQFMCVFDIAEGRVKASLKIQRQRRSHTEGLTLKHCHTEKDRRKPYRFHWCMEGCPHPAKSRMAAPTNLAMTHEQRMRRNSKKKKAKKKNGGSVQHPTLAEGARGFFRLCIVLSLVFFSPLLSPCLMLKSQAGRTRARRRPLSPLRQARFGEMLLACSGYIRSTHLTVNQQPSKTHGTRFRFDWGRYMFRCCCGSHEPRGLPRSSPLSAVYPYLLAVPLSACHHNIAAPPPAENIRACPTLICGRRTPLSCSAHGARRSRGALYEESTKEKEGRPTLCSRKHVSKASRGS